ncbi:amine oxidase, partial [Aureobasidium melanogenum]
MSNPLDTNVNMRSASHATSEQVDVVIIGAGLAGLTATRDVIKSGLSCIILEARDRVGGKTWSQQLPDGKGTIDLGAAWINDVNQTRVYALAKQYNAELIEQNTAGNCAIQDASGTISSFPYGELPSFDAEAKEDVARIRDMCEADCQALDTFNPDDRTLDSMSFEAYLHSRGASETSMSTATVWTRAMLGQEPKDLSALYFLNYCKSGGGLLQMRSDRKGGGQHLRVRQGMQLFSKGLASDMPDGVIRLSNPVTAINNNTGNGAVEVHTKDQIILARKVITTVPTPVLRNISFSPDLPSSKRTWIESTTYGYYTKAMMVFRTPFWVEKSFCGLTQSFIGPAGVIRDTSSPADNKHILTCFLGGKPGFAWAELSDTEREQSLLKQIGQLFNAEDVAEKEFVQLVTYEWIKDEYSGWGCPCTGLPPGVLSLLGGGSLREPWADMHFAGTETAGEWKGYMEGAVRSGERAATEEKTTTSSTAISGLSSKIIFHDIGAISDPSGQASRLKKGLLFVSTPIEFATTIDKRYLRVDLGMKTIVNTLARPDGRRFVFDGPALDKKSENFCIEDVLGLKSCLVVLRSDAFGKKAMNEMSSHSRWKFERDAAATKNRKDPELLEISRDLLWKRSNVDDNSLILFLSGPIIGRLFNEVLCKPDFYPIIISGDRIMRDNSLLVFLLLLVLDTPFSVIEHIYLQVSEGLPFKLDEESNRQWEKDVRFEASAWAQDRSRWARVLRQRLEGRYGSVSAYFTTIGVAEATRNSIKEILLAGESKALIDFS